MKKPTMPQMGMIAMRSKLVSSSVLKFTLKRFRIHMKNRHPTKALKGTTIARIVTSVRGKHISRWAKTAATVAIVL